MLCYPRCTGIRRCTKRKNPRQREKYRQAWQQAAQNLQTEQPCRKANCNAGWAKWMARNFHRSSSAVESRNGYLSQMVHNARGLNEKRLRALTVIHNYGLKRADDGNALVWSSAQTFPNLFSCLVGEIGELPLPRKGRERASHNPLYFSNCPGLNWKPRFVAGCCLDCRKFATFEKLLTKKRLAIYHKPFIFNGASDRNRTGTPSQARDFKSRASTYFATEAKRSL